MVQVLPKIAFAKQKCLGCKRLVFTLYCDNCAPATDPYAKFFAGDRDKHHEAYSGSYRNGKPLPIATNLY